MYQLMSNYLSKKICLVLCFQIILTHLSAAYLRVNGGYILPRGALFNFLQIFHVLKFSVLCALVYSDSIGLDCPHFMMFCGCFWYSFHSALFSHCVFILCKYSKKYKQGIGYTQLIFLVSFGSSILLAV